MIQKFIALTCVLFFSFFKPLLSQDLSRLDLPVNTEDKDEILPVVNAKDNAILFTRVGDPDFKKVLVVEGNNVYDQDKWIADSVLMDIYKDLGDQAGLDPAASVFNQDIFIGYLDDAGTIKKLVHPNAPLNNALPNAVLSYIPDYNRYIVNNIYYQSGGMSSGISMVKQNANGTWTFPVPIDVDGLSTSSNSFSMCSNRDGTVFIFSLARPDSKGETDLYVSFRESDGSYSVPYHIKDWVNSTGKETNPTLSVDGRYMFFSSNRPGSQGMDIYYSKRKGESWLDWGSPQKLEAPINSDFDDSQPQFDEVHGRMYFSSNREGSMDIFKYPYALEEDVFIEVNGIVSDLKTGKTLRSLVSVEVVGSDYARSISVNSNGRFTVDIPVGKQIRFTAEKNGYFTNTVEVYIGQSYDLSRDLELQLSKVKFERGMEHIILFKQTSLEVLDAQGAQHKLERLLERMKKDPKFLVVIEGHTDNMGEWNNLLRLSEERAKLIRDQLIELGANPSRIQIAAYGADKPISSNETEKSRAKNRRVSFRMEELNN